MAARRSSSSRAHGFHKHGTRSCHFHGRAGTKQHHHCARAHSSSSRRKGNPEAWALYEAFHGREPRELVKARVPAMPAKLWALGRLHSVVYERPGERTPYEHVFHKPKPLLCSDASGRRLYIVGGGYKVRHVGIVR